MQARVQKIDSDGVHFALDIAEALNLVEGSEVEIRPSSDKVLETPHIRFATVDEALAAHRRTEPEYRDVYRELAK